MEGTARQSASATMVGGFALTIQEVDEDTISGYGLWDSDIGPLRARSRAAMAPLVWLRLSSLHLLVRHLRPLVEGVSGDDSYEDHRAAGSRGLRSVQRTSRLRVPGSQRLAPPESRTARPDGHVDGPRPHQPHGEGELPELDGAVRAVRDGVHAKAPLT